MQTIEEMTANSKAPLSTVSDIIGALQNILAREQATITDLESPYSRFPNTDQSVMHKDQSCSVSDIITERQQQLDAALHEISGLETVMDGIKNLHRQLVEKKDKITQSMNLHKGLLSALWRMPTEITSQIFHHCLPEFDPSSRPSNLKAPMLLTRICRRWREVAVSTPNLWCRLSVLAARTNQWEQHAFGCDLWLKRSRGIPLSLYLDCGANDATKIRNLLKLYTHQISSLSITFDQQAHRPELLLYKLPALQELVIGGFIDPYVIAPSISRLPSTMRSLKVIDMVPFFDTVCLTSFGPVWAHLTNVEIGVRQPNAVILLLQLCPNLSSLKIRLAFDDDLTATFEPYMHTKIQSLRIVNVSFISRHLSDMLNALSLPNLRVLEAYGYHEEPWPRHRLKEFLAGSKCPLERLFE